MDVAHILATIDVEIAKLQKAKITIAALERGTKPETPAELKKAAVTAKDPRRITPEGRARIVAAQKARWAKRDSAQHEEIVVAQEETIPG